MYLDYSKIDAARRETPAVRLRTMAGVELGPVPFVYGLRFEINYADLSTVEFSVPRFTKGFLNPLYSAITGYKELYTENLGRYVLASPTTENDGVSEVKKVQGYSLEYVFSKKKLFLEEGTYNFWNPADPEDTILGRIVELDPTWSVGEVAPRLIGCYRTFDQYDDWALDFLYGDAMEKYRCAVVFDVYKKTINVYDADEDTPSLPIYLNFKNLVDNTETEELTDELVTKLHAYGADDVDIREVNPTGEDYIVDLTAFLENGDLDVIVDGARLSDRVRSWQDAISEKQPLYMGLVGSRASLTAELMAARAELTERNNELDTLTIQQSAIIQAQSLEQTEEGKKTWQGKLDDINAQIAAQRERVTEQEGKISTIQSGIDGYAEKIAAITGALSYAGYFTENERAKLNNFLIEDEISESTFVASDVDTGVSGTISEFSGSVNITGSEIVRAEMEDFDKTLYTLRGGQLNTVGTVISAQIVRGTLDRTPEGGYTLTAYLGGTSYAGHDFPSGLLTLSGTLTGFDSDLAEANPETGDLARGTCLRFDTSGADAFFTVNCSEFQRYCVELELYDYASEVLKDAATPTYEFSVDSANFLYQEKFEPFKDKLELGKSVFLELGSHGRIRPKLIGIELDFDDITELELVFSNRYKLSNGAEKWAEEIRTSSRSSHSFDASKYIYNRWADRSTAVSDFMNGTLDAAKNTILAAANQSVWADSAGLHIGRGNDQMRLVDSMIAMTDDGWQTAKMAIGRFATEDTGEVWGVNGELVAGKLIVGNNLILENPTDGGVMQFKVDATGAWLYNSRFVLQSENGLVIMDPKYGLAAGTKLLLDANGTTVTPEFLDEAGDIVFDDDGLPKNANFYLDVRDGSAYFRGTVYAEDGVFNGTVYATDGEFTGTVHAKAGEFTGTVNANDGTFKGTVQASKYLDTAGKDMMNDGKFKSDYLEVDRLNVADNFIVDEYGNVTTNGDVTLGGNIVMSGSITWSGNGPVQYRFSTSASGPWHSTMESGDRYRQDSLDGGKNWGAAYQFRGTDGANGRNGSDASVTYDNILSALKAAYNENKTTFITADGIGTPVIYGGLIEGGTIRGEALIESPVMIANNFSVFPEGTREDAARSAIAGETGFNLYANSTIGGGMYHFFNIRFHDTDSPFVNITSPANASITIGGDQQYSRSVFMWGDISFGGSRPGMSAPSYKSTVDFSNVTVTGLKIA